MKNGSDWLTVYCVEGQNKGVFDRRKNSRRHKHRSGSGFWEMKDKFSIKSITHET